MSSMSIAVDISIARRNSLAPLSTTLEVNVLNVGTSVDNVGIDTLTTLIGVEILVEGGKG